VSVVAGVALAVGVAGDSGHTLSVGTARTVVEAGVAFLAEATKEAGWTDATETASDARRLTLSAVVAWVG
jgi:hypothetical protein